jgi:hypothetical protein
MTVVAIGPLAAGSAARYAQLAASLALLTGLLAAVAWLLRLGFLADLSRGPTGLRPDDLAHRAGGTCGPVTKAYVGGNVIL